MPYFSTVLLLIRLLPMAGVAKVWKAVLRAAIAPSTGFAVAVGVYIYPSSFVGFVCVLQTKQ
jgi:hypothetical protein